MKIDGLRAAAYTVPTEAPESDGTLTWDSTTVVVVEVEAGGVTGTGFTYATRGCIAVIDDVLRSVVVAHDPMDVPGAAHAMAVAIRNLGRPGVVSSAIAAVDLALWDLKARLLELPLFRLLGAVRDEVPIYGSGGFTSYSPDELVRQIGSWVHDDGIPRVKMKIGTNRGAEPRVDLARVETVRGTIGGAELFVDANGGYTAKQAVTLARELAALDVTWFEEPVSSDHLASLREIRDLIDIEVAAGEYGYDLPYFEQMCAAGAVDVLQADISRCGGLTDWLRVAAVAAAHGLELSGHCAPSLHAHAACSVPNLRHVEYFHDHARIDRLLFDGALDPTGGVLRPDPERPGMGLELKRADAERHLVERSRAE
ncbi:MAG TPA: enolase C-terminal domain-like protein [Acidimicrobiia bacterium]|nr:enolase C-terminal domain-like protein [Acidimicrobiia bacterium]